MAIFRGIGGAGDSTTDATVTAVTEQATNAANSATAAASSASNAATSATNAATSATNAATSATNASASETAAAASETAAAASETAAAASETAAAASETAAAASETAAAASESAAATSETNAATSASSASTSATAAAASATAAASSASAASTSETNAAASASAASTSETNAATSESNAATSASSASTSASNAATSETNAASSASAAATSASNASTSETNAASSASAASTSETNAAASASAASTSETNAAASESAAATSASNAATSASNASTSETNASNSATAAASSATSAASSASSASTSASNAATSETNAATSETNAATSETNAASSATSAASSATSASTSASNASTSETNAASSASSASTSATNAATSATSAASSATSAASAQTAAESARDSALAAYDNFDDRYLGAKSSDPSVDNDGNALVAGALYFNTTDEIMKVYTGSTWVDAYAAGTTFLAKASNLSDLANAATARTNLGVAIGTDVQAYSSVLAATTASFTTAKDSKLSGIETGADVTDATNVAAAGAAMDSDFTSQGLMKRGATSGSYSIVTDNSTNWNTAYGWGNHASAGYLTDITGENLGDLSNVTLTSPSNGQILKYNGTAWVNGTDAGGIALTDLSVGAEGTASGDGAIAYNNTSGVFTYTPPTAAGIGAATSAQGALADSATQPGDNISTLTNDSGFITASDNITGNAATATNATNVALTNTSTASNFYIPFASGNTTGNYALGVDAGFYYNPSNNRVYANSFYTSYVYVIGFVELSGDDDYISWGSAYDAKMFYDGVNNTFEMELEADATSFIITDNGTTRFTFDKSTGNFTATGDVNAVDGTFSGNVTGSNLNVSNWDTAYGWGNHASAGYLTSETSHADVVVDGDFASQGLMKRGATAGSYSIVTDNSTNWNTAYGWGDHASAGYLTGITGQSIKNLSDVYSSMTPTDGQVLTYDTTNGWQAETPSGGGGGTVGFEQNFLLMGG